MFKSILYRLAYPLFAADLAKLNRLNNAITGIHRWCAADKKADLITTHLLNVRDDKIGHSDDVFRDRLRSLDSHEKREVKHNPMQTNVVTRVSVPESRPVLPEYKTQPKERDKPDNYSSSSPVFYDNYSSSDSCSSSSDYSSSSDSSSSSSCGGD